MLIYPPGKLYQRGEDRAQCNIEDSTAGSIHACNDLGYAASILRKEQYDIFLCDYQTEGKNIEDVKNDLINFSPNLILISTTNATIYKDISFIKEVKRICNCKIVLKGAIFYDIKSELLAHIDFSEIDCAIGGELEFIIAPLVNSLLKGNMLLSSVPGIIYFDETGFHKTSFDYNKNDLDSIPFPARDLMNNELYTRPDTGNPMATITVARGCPSNCIFCLTPQITGKNVRLRSIDNIFSEIKECYYKYGIKDFFFKADTFTINKQWAISLCDKIISSELYQKISFTANSRADTLSLELLSKMKEAGCFMLAIGFESGNDESLKMIKKGTTTQINLNAAKMVKSVGIPLFGFFIIGFPWENKNTIEQTFSHILDINPDFVELHLAMPYFDTELYTICEQSHILSDDSLGFDTINPNTIGTSYVDLKDLLRMKRKFLIKFYTRPHYVLSKITRNILSPAILFHYFKYGMKLFKHR